MRTLASYTDVMPAMWERPDARALIEEDITQSLYGKPDRYSWELMGDVVRFIAERDIEDEEEIRNLEAK